MSLNSFLGKIGIDKCLHFGFGGLICALITFVFILQDMDTLENWQIIISPTIGTLFVFILQMVKESTIDDKFSWADTWASLLGCIPVYLAVALGILFKVLSYGNVY